MKEVKETFSTTACRRETIIFLLSFLIFLASIRVEARPPEVADRLNGAFLKQLLADTGEIITSPTRWAKDDWLTFSLSLATSCAWWSVDNSIHEWIHDTHHPGLTSVSKVLSGAGHPLSLIGIFSAGYLAGELTGSSSLRQTFLLSAESLLITELFVQAGKIAIGWARPYTLEGSSSFHLFTLKGDWQSFPSGHSSAAWAVATTIASRTKCIYLKVLLYSLSAGISLSRVILDKHFASDIVASSLLGYYISQKIGHKTASQVKEPDQPAVSLSVAPGLISLNLSYQF